MSATAETTAEVELCTGPHCGEVIGADGSRELHLCGFCLFLHESQTRVLARSREMRVKGRALKARIETAIRRDGEPANESRRELPPSDRD